MSDAFKVQEGPPERRPRKPRKSQYDPLVEAAFKLEPGQHIVYPLSPEVRREERLVKRKAESVSSLLRRRVRSHHKHRLIVSVNLDNNVVIECLKKRKGDK